MDKAACEVRLRPPFMQDVVILVDPAGAGHLRSNALSYPLQLCLESHPCQEVIAAINETVIDHRLSEEGWSTTRDAICSNSGGLASVPQTC